MTGIDILGLILFAGFAYGLYRFLKKKKEDE